MKYFSQKIFAVFLAAGMMSAQAQTFITQPKTIEWDSSILHSNRCGNHCPDFQFSLVDTGEKWIDNILNKHIITQLDASGFEENSVQFKRLQTLQNKTYLNDMELKQLIELTFRSGVEMAIDMKDDFDFDKDSVWHTAPVVSISSTPRYIGHKKHLEMFEVSSDSYHIGAAHGMAWVHYFVFDTQNKKQLNLNDILIKGQKGKLNDLLQKALIEWDKELADFNSEPIQAHDNFIFTRKGIQFLYQIYDIAPYAAGMPVFEIPYQKLHGIVKAEYLD